MILRIRHINVIGFIGLVWALISGQAWALTPTAEPPSILITEADAAFDDTTVRQAMLPLETRGLRIVAIFVQTGDGDDFLARLQALGLAQGSQLEEDVVALYVAIDTRYSEVKWNTRRYDTVIPALDLRRSAMNPSLRDGLYDQAFARALIALEAGLLQFDLGTPIATAAAPTSSETTSAPAGESGAVLGPLLCLGGIGVLIFIFRNSNSGGSSDSSSSSWSSTSDSGSSSSSSDSGGGSDGGSWSD